MSNISVIDSCCCIPFFNDYVIESVIMKNGSDDRNVEAIPTHLRVLFCDEHTRE